MHHQMYGQYGGDDQSLVVNTWKTIFDFNNRIHPFEAVNGLQIVHNQAMTSLSRNAGEVCFSSLDHGTRIILELTVLFSK